MGVTNRPPEEEAGPEEREVLEIVEEAVSQRRLVGVWNVPAPQRDDVGEPRHRHPRQQSHNATDNGGPYEETPDGPTSSSGKPPEDHRQRVGEQQKRRRHHHEELVLNHVHGEEV